jgi:hypothetical protein
MGLKNLLGIGHHGSKLPATKQATILADSLVTKEYRSAITANGHRKRADHKGTGTHKQQHKG